jgi:phosphoesterase RecJ-like protein
MNPRLETLIPAAHQILILTHVEPDADAVGSLLGLGQALKALARARVVVMGCSDPIPSRYARLPGCAEIVSHVNCPFDLFISLDCADQKRMGSLYQEACRATIGTEQQGRIPLINIDHHISNTEFGSANWVDPNAVATSEMVLELLDRLGVPVSANIATCLLYGIVGDTLAFRTQNVTPQVLAKVIRLMQLGAPLHQAIADLFQRKPLSLLAIWGRALGAMRVEGHLAWTTLSVQDRRDCGYPSTDGLQLSSLLLEADGVDVTALFVEDDAGDVEISMRARNGFDVSRLAIELGGGGHASAAGAKVAGPLEQVAATVTSRLKQFISQAP